MTKSQLAVDLSKRWGARFSAPTPQVEAATSLAGPSAAPAPGPERLADFLQQLLSGDARGIALAEANRRFGRDLLCTGEGLRRFVGKAPLPTSRASWQSEFLRVSAAMEVIPHLLRRWRQQFVSVGPRRGRWAYGQRVPRTRVCGYPCICLHTFACMYFSSWRSAPLSLRLLYVFPACYCGIVESPPAPWWVCCRCHVVSPCMSAHVHSVSCWTHWFWELLQLVHPGLCAVQGLTRVSSAWPMISNRRAHNVVTSTVIHFSLQRLEFIFPTFSDLPTKVFFLGRHSGPHSQWPARAHPHHSMICGGSADAVGVAGSCCVLLPVIDPAAQLETSPMLR